MKIGFTVDTNMLEGSNAKTTSLSKNLDFYLKYIKVLSRKDKQNTLTLFLSEVVTSEVIKHETEKINAAYDSLKSKFQELDYIFDGNLPDNKIESILRNEKNFIKKLHILKVPTSEENFKKLIHAALETTPPFIKQKGDAGFKDALIWESILSSNEIDECDKFYFFTCDTDFLEYQEYFKNEFIKYHKNCSITIIGFEKNDNDKRQQALSYIIKENKLIETNITKLFDEDFILTYIHELNNRELPLDSNKIKIEFSNLEKENIVIRDVIEHENIYDVLLDINTYNYHDSSKLAPIQAKLKLIFEVVENKFSVINHEITNISYVDAIMGNFMKELSELSESIKELYKQPLEELHAITSSPMISDQMRVMVDNINKMTEPFKVLRKEFETTNAIRQFQEIRNQISGINPLVQAANKQIKIANQITGINPLTQAVNRQIELANQITENRVDIISNQENH